MTPETFMMRQRPGFADGSRPAQGPILLESDTRGRFVRIWNQEDTFDDFS